MKALHLVLAFLLPCAALTGRAEQAGHSQESAVYTPAHPFFRTALYPAWSKMTPQQALIDLERAIAEADARLEAIAALAPEQATFENTFLAYEQAEENIRQLMAYLRHLANMGVNPALQKCMTDVSARTAAHGATRRYTEQVKQVLLEAAKAPWVSKLCPAKQRFVQKITEKFDSEAATLTPEQRKRRAEISMELMQLARQFSDNIRKGANTWQCIITDPAQLHGMPEKWMQRAAQAAERAGHPGAWLVTAATAHDVLRQCTVEATRRQCWPATVATATALAADNEPILYRILELRHETATMLGHKNYAEMKVHGRMVRNAEHALSIIDDLLHKSKPAWDAHVAAEMERFSRAAGRKLATINPWDVAYYNSILPPNQKGFDYSKITPYLQAEKCITGLMNLWADLLNIRFTELPTVCLKNSETCPADKVEVWHPSVRFYTVHDAATNAHLGSFYLDLYPRRGKGGPAWCMPLRQGNPATNNRPAEPHLAVLVANVTPPAKGRPHLLAHHELYTLHHEFGHLMHHILARGAMRTQGSMGTEQDFLEVPSQLQENWAWEPEALATFAFHHATGEPLPAELAQQVAADRCKSPLATHMQMLWAAKLDLEFHMFFYEKFKGRPLDEVCAEILAPWQMPWSVPVPTLMRTMDYNITKGYDAGLYIYKWAEVLSDEAFTRFRKEGIMNRATGAAYRHAILEKGGSEPAAKQFLDFLGREPSTDALMQRYQPRIEQQ
ncbi:MAG: M3 family metallopeptidase [Akkermansia sp.]|nr:M3 family metallopeptidase [Akkermansia sp.]